jgi:hypothetical protein
MKSFGGIPDLNFNSLCCKNNMIINNNCELTVKTAKVGNLNVVNDLIVDGIIQGTDKLSITNDVLINGSNTKLYNAMDEHSRIAYIEGNVASNVIVSPLSSGDPTTIEIIMEPCDGNLSNIDPITGNVTYTSIGNVLGQIDSYQYSIEDCGTKNIVTQYVCRPSSAMPPFLNGCCVNGCFGEIDFRGWTVEDFLLAASPVWTSIWSLSNEGKTAKQIRGGPEVGVLYSDCDFGACQTAEIPVTPKIQAAGGPFSDDDYIGFALGYSPGDATNANADWILIDWKRATQFFDYSVANSTTPDSECTPGGLGLIGLALSRVSGTPNRDELWQHTTYTGACTAATSGVNEIARGATLGSTGWVLETTYIFRIEYSTKHLKVWVDNVLQFDLTGDFPVGRLGVYQFSQEVEFGQIGTGPASIIGRRQVNFATNGVHSTVTSPLPLGIPESFVLESESTFDLTTTATGSLVSLIYGVRSGSYSLGKSETGLDWTFMNGWLLQVQTANVTMVINNFNVVSPNHKKGYFYNAGIAVPTSPLTITTNPPNLQQSWTVVGTYFPDPPGNNQDPVVWDNISGTLSHPGGSFHTSGIMLDMGDLSQYTSVTITYTTTAITDGITFGLAEEIIAPYDLCCCVPAQAVVGSAPIDPSTVDITRVEELSGNVTNELCLIDFTGWTPDQYPNVILSDAWVISPGGYTATETRGLPGATPHTVLSGTDLDLCEWIVQIDASAPINDLFGFVIGYNPGDAFNPNANFLAFGWGDKTYLRHITGAVPPPNVSGMGMGNFTTDEPPYIKQLGTGLNFGSTMWTPGVTYTFRFEYAGGIFRIYIDNALEFELPWTFVNGANVGLSAVSCPVPSWTNGFKWTNVSCPCTALIPDNEWIPSGNVTASVDASGVLTVSSSEIEKAVRVGVTIDETQGQTSNEALNYFGFKCIRYLEFIETVIVPSANPSPTFTSFTSDPDKRYAFVATGLIQFNFPANPRRRLDAKFGTNTYPTNWYGPVPPIGSSRGFLIIDGSATWQTGSSVNLDHRYLDVRQGTGAQFGLLLTDSAHTDNFGNFTVHVYEIC